MKDTAVLLIDCPDRKGLVARVSGLLYEHGANILHADQHQDHDLGKFFMRVEWALMRRNADAAKSIVRIRPGEVQQGIHPDCGGVGDALAGRCHEPADQSRACSARNTFTAWPICCTAGSRAS